MVQPINAGQIKQQIKVCKEKQDANILIIKKLYKKPWRSEWDKATIPFRIERLNYKNDILEQKMQNLQKILKSS